MVPGAELVGGARVPGTRHELDPVAAAFNIGAMVRWLDFNDTWLAAEWGHPSDNLGAILAVADYLARKRVARPLTMGDVLTAMIQAHEIQGVLALNHSFNRVGLDHVLLVRVASTAVADAFARRQSRPDRERGVERVARRRRAAQPTATRRTRARARAGPRATRRAAVFGMR